MCVTYKAAERFEPPQRFGGTNTNRRMLEGTKGTLGKGTVQKVGVR